MVLEACILSVDGCLSMLLDIHGHLQLVGHVARCVVEKSAGGLAQASEMR